MIYLYKVPRWIALGIVLLVGAGIFGVQQLGEVWREHQWLATPGQVVSAQEVTRQCGRQECQRLQVEYRYSVGASSYTGQADLDARPGAYPAGAAVPVLYDPGSPAQSTLDPNAPGGRAVGLGIAGVIAALGVGCLLKGLI